MSVIVKAVANKKDLTTFVEFANKLYKGNPYYIPTLAADDKDLFTPGKNAALEFCQNECYLAYKDNKVVGRVAAIINPVANQKFNTNTVRFGWFDFIDDREVSKALLDAVIKWGKARGCDYIEGPFGFADMDPEGMLVEGFDKLGTMITFYNHPYYMKHMEDMGYVKKADWLEYKVNIPEEIPEKYDRVAKLVMEKNNLRVRRYKRSEIAKCRVGEMFFDLVNEAYSNLYGVTPLTDNQIKQYTAMYLRIMDLDLVTFVVDENDELVAFGATIPSMSRALQKSGGHYFPFGWFHLLKTMIFKDTDTVDFLLVAVRNKYKGKGLPAILFHDLAPKFKKYGFKYAETNPELEDNVGVRNLWNSIDRELTKRRRVWGKSI